MKWKKKLGDEKVHQFRRSWDLRPDPLDKNNVYHPINIETYKKIPSEKIPDTESLKDTYERVIKFYKQEIENKTNENILISAHGNSIRALCKYLFNLDNNQISKLEIPTGNPLLIMLENGKMAAKVILVSIPRMVTVIRSSVRVNPLLNKSTLILFVFIVPFGWGSNDYFQLQSIPYCWDWCRYQKKTSIHWTDCRQFFQNR